MQVTGRTALAVLVFCVCSSGQVVPGRYIIELTTPPVAGEVDSAGVRLSPRSAAAATHRARVRAEQAGVRARLNQANITVLDSLDTVANALVVDAPNATLLNSIPGVQKVYPVRQKQLLLDRAVQLHNVVSVWNQFGIDKAGAGVKVAIIDTGVDNNSPGLKNSSLTPPATFPRTNQDSDLDFTNGKVIVARSYVHLLSAHDPDTSARDRMGHGTALAMIIGGVRTAAPLATITGIAPQAWIGSYKVFGSPGVNDNANDAAILKALDDAVADGMDVINLSLGSPLATRLADDPTVGAIDRAALAGVIVVAAAGNTGPDSNTIASPATARSAISVGASTNDRMFSTAVQAGDQPSAVSLPGDGPKPSADVTGPGFDVGALTTDGQACSALPADSLSGRIALIRRGSCAFETKLNNAQQAGAIGAVVTALGDSPAPVGMAVGSATLPGQMVSYSAGEALRAAIASDSNTRVTMHFGLSPVPMTPNLLPSFSAIGPDVDLSIKPDLLAVGSSYYTASQTFDTKGEMYDPSGFVSVNGTSFSAPTVAGIAALIKSLRPGLTVDQYRSLLVNSARELKTSDGHTLGIQRGGTGLADAQAALNSTTAVTPVSVSFGAGSNSGTVGRLISVQNLSTADETYSVSAESPTCTQLPTLASGDTLPVRSGKTAGVAVSFDATGLAAGGCEGTITFKSLTSGTVVRVPWWYAVTSDIPSAVTQLHTTDTGRRGRVLSDAVLFRMTDSAGVPITSVQPQVTVVTGGGEVSAVNSYDSDVPGLFGLDLRLGPTAGTNTFEIRAGDIRSVVTITGN